MKRRVLIRPLTPADAAEFQALRLSALRDTPEAFGSTFEEEEATPIPTIAKRLADPSGNSFVLGASLDTDISLIGLAACFRQTGRKERHRATVGGMYVAPQARGLGVGSRLLDAVIERARQWEGLEHLTLTVVPQSAAARALYATRGFRSFGMAPKALKHGDVYFDLEYLWLPLAS